MSSVLLIFLIIVIFALIIKHCLKPVSKTGGAKKNRFFIVSYVRSLFENILKERGNWVDAYKNKTYKTKNLDLFHNDIGNNVKKETYESVEDRPGIKDAYPDNFRSAVMKNFVKGLRKKTMKINIHKLFNGTSYKKRTWKLQDIDMKTEHMKFPVIVKPAWGSQGIGIVVAENRKELIKSVKDMDKELVKAGIVISEYINNPLLIDGRKFHFRMYFVVSLLDRKTKGYMLNTGRIYTARDKYKKSDYSNKFIHDSHLETTSKSIVFPDDFDKYHKGKAQGITKQMVKILEHLYKQLDLETFSESKHAYRVCGVDFMVDENFKVYIIEINNSPMMKASKHFKEPINRVEKKLYQSVAVDIIDPIFPPANKIEQTSYFINLKADK